MKEYHSINPEDKRKQSWVCQECAQIFISPQGFHTHMREIHPHVEYREKSKKPKVEENESESLCMECGKTFPCLSALNSHVTKSHRNNKTFNCPECLKMFPNNSRLSRHVRIFHLNQRDYECDRCGKRFMDKSKLIQHVTAVHDKLKPYLCDLCPFECSKVGNLNLHRKKQHGAETTNKAKLIAQVKDGNHPYYNEESFQLLLVAQ